MPKVLLVDDDSSYPHKLADFLSLHGWQAAVSPSGMDALQKLQSESFEGVVLDRRMTGMTGDDVLRWITEQPQLQDVCVVMLTGYGTVASAVDSLKLGAWQFLVKADTSLNDIKSVLSAGIAWKHCRRIQGELVTAFDRRLVLSRVRQIILEEVPADAFHILYIPAEGPIADWTGADLKGVNLSASWRPQFVQRILQGAPLVFEVAAEKVRELEPLLPDAKSLMAVPVKGEQSNPIGVLEMESLWEKGIDPWWQDLLRYVADIVGLSLVVEQKAQTILEQKVAAEQNKAKNAELIYRELRHRIGTHAQIVSMQAARLKNSQDYPQPVRERAALIERNAEAINAVVQELRDVSRPLRITREPLDLTLLAHEAVSSLTPRLEKAHVRVQWRNDDHPSPIIGDRNLLIYTLDCVLQNAIDAIEERRRQDPAAAQQEDVVTLEFAGAESSHVLRISDTGIGFDGEAEQMLFQPAFSTKVRTGISRENVEYGAALIARMLDLLAERVLEVPDDELQGKREFALSIEDRQDDSAVMRISHPELHKVFEVETSMPRKQANRGMGLYTVRRVLTEHEGEILPQSKGLYRGATFIVSLPKAG
jgi:signal transduction histidine kinase